MNSFDLYTANFDLQLSHAQTWASALNFKIIRCKFYENGIKMSRRRVSADSNTAINVRFGPVKAAHGGHLPALRRGNLAKMLHTGSVKAEFTFFC